MGVVLIQLCPFNYSNNPMAMDPLLAHSTPTGMRPLVNKWATGIHKDILQPKCRTSFCKECKLVTHPMGILDISRVIWGKDF